MDGAGISYVRQVDRPKWSDGSFTDFTDVLNERNREYGYNDLTGFETEGEQFNLIGYSRGGLQAAQTALDYIDRTGGYVDHIVLIASPISKKLLIELRKNSNIGKVIVHDLTEHGDPVYAGMDAGELIKSVPALNRSKKALEEGNAIDHHYYSGDGEEGEKRRMALAKWLFQQGLR